MLNFFNEEHGIKEVMTINTDNTGTVN